MSYFGDVPSEYRLIVEEQDGLKPAREFAPPSSRHDCAPSWSPGSKRVADAPHLKSHGRATLVTNVDMDETKLVIDGVADAMYPAFDASGKDRWFLASIGFGLRSHWLDMAWYDREKRFGLFLAVLKKGEPGPLLLENDEDIGVSGAPPGPAKPPSGAGSAGARGGCGGPRRRPAREAPSPHFG